MPKILTDTLYCYVEAGNASHARKQGAKLFGSFSAYVNALIAKDRGVKPKLGQWKAKGESKKLRGEPAKASKTSSKPSLSASKNAKKSGRVLLAEAKGTLDKLASQPMPSMEAPATQPTVQ